MSDQDWIYSESISLSTPTLKGKFFLECYDTEGNAYFTEDLPFSARPHDISVALIHTCPWLRDAIDVYYWKSGVHHVDGIDFFIYFRGIKGPLEQFKIHSSLTEPLVGTNITYEMESLEKYGSKVYYDVIPFEQLYTFSTEPPITVTIDNYPVLCKSTYCSYTYEAQTSLVTGFTIVDQDVTISGTALPTDILELRVSNMICEVSAKSDTQIICSLPHPLVAGSWHPKIRTDAGFVPVDPSVSTVDVPLVITL